MTESPRHGGPSDRDIERRLERWLADLPDRAGGDLTTGAIQRARATRQRPAALASRAAGRRPGLAWAALATASVAVLLSVGLAALTLGWPAAPGLPDVEPAPSSAINGRVTRTTSLDRQITAVGFASGSLWVADTGGRLLRLDPTSGAEMGRIELGVEYCGAMSEVAGSIWLSGCRTAGTDGTTALRVDAAGLRVVNRYGDGAGAGIGASAMDGLIWFVSDVATGTISAVDSTTGEPRGEVVAGVRVRFATAGFGTLWASTIGQPTVLRLDPIDGRTLAAIRLSGDPSMLLVTADSVWVAEPHQWLVGRIDPVADRIALESEAATGVDQLVAAPNHWIWALGEAEAIAMDRSGATVDRVPVPAHLDPNGIALHVLAAGGTSIWLADGRTLLEIPADQD